MTVSSTSVQTGLLAGNDSTTAFPFTFRVWSTADVGFITVDSTGTESTKVLEVDFSVSLNANQQTSPGGTVTYPISGDPLATGSSARVFSQVSGTQSAALSNQGNQFPVVTERGLDRLTVIVNQLVEKAGRALSLKRTSTLTNITFPAPEAGKYLVGNTDEDGFDNADPGSVALAVPADGSVSSSKLGGDIGVYIKSFVQSANAAAARTALGATAAGSDFFTAANAAAQRALLGFTSFGASLVAAADAAAARTLLGVSASVPVGGMVQFRFTSSATSTSTTTAIPVDNTVPQVTEGTSILSDSITCSSATNGVLIRVSVPVKVVHDYFGTIALFASDNGGAATCLHAVLLGGNDGTDEQHSASSFEWYMVPGNTHSWTFSVRVGGSGGTTKVLVNNTGYGGVEHATMSLTEISAS